MSNVVLDRAGNSAAENAVSTKTRNLFCINPPLFIDYLFQLGDRDDALLETVYDTMDSVVKMKTWDVSQCSTQIFSGLTYRILKYSIMPDASHKIKWLCILCNSLGTVIQNVPSTAFGQPHFATQQPEGEYVMQILLKVDFFYRIPMSMKLPAQPERGTCKQGGRDIKQRQIRGSKLVLLSTMLSCRGEVWQCRYWTPPMTSKFWTSWRL
jgi:hypothetical protein